MSADRSFTIKKGVSAANIHKFNYHTPSG